MPKVTLTLNDFKALASETRLDILRALDGKKMSLKEISVATKLHEVTIHEHLSKLVEADFVKKNEREGHKWVYYKLSWKGTSLIHPENTRVVVLFSFTFITLFFGVVSLISFIQGRMGPVMASGSGTEIVVSDQNLMPLFFSIGCLQFFIILMAISIWRYKKNKSPKL